MDAQQKIAIIQALVGQPEQEPKQEPARPTNWDELMAQAKSLPAQFKVDMITAMGFTPIGSDHTDSCPYAIDSGLVCNCVPPSTMWAQPNDVDELRGETWEQRRERAVNGPPRRIPAVER